MRLLNEYLQICIFIYRKVLFSVIIEIFHCDVHWNFSPDKLKNCSEKEHMLFCTMKLKRHLNVKNESIFQPHIKCL